VTDTPGGVTPTPGGSSFQKGPNPTQASVQSANGPFRYTSRNVTAPGFASGVLFTPTEPGTYGGIVLIPPYLVNSSALLPFAQRYASNGFVVLALNVRSTTEYPNVRAEEGKAGVKFIKNQDKVDANRIGVGGYSMGGGATLEVVSADPSIKAAVPTVPWDLGKRFPNDRVPTMILGGQADTVAPPAQHASVFYGSIPSATPKGIALATGASHFIPSTPPAGFTQLAVAWMKYYVDGDTRYKPFITRPGGLSDFQLSGVN